MNEDHLNPPEDPEYDHEKLLAAIKAMDEGRNPSCWPILSFGGKDADLDPGGCTGIRAVQGLHGTRKQYFVVEVGGHKSISHPQAWGLNLTVPQVEMYEQLMTDLICDIGGPGEWDGDSWVMYHEGTVQVAAMFHPGFAELDYAETAAAIVEGARMALAPWEDQMAALDTEADNLYLQAEAEEGSEANA